MTSLVGRLDGGGAEAAEALRTLHSADELMAARRDGNVLVDWNTEPPAFKPTFKVLRGQKLEYQKKRIPSWCDRVLWKSLPGAAKFIRQTHQEACAGFLTSDHKPIRAGFEVAMQVAAPKVSATSNTVLTVRGLKATLNKYKTLDVPDPYVEFFSDPDGLLRHVKSSNGRRSKQARTHILSDTWAPDWSHKEPEIQLQLLVHDKEDMQRCHLHLCCVDKNRLSSDDTLGSATLDLSKVYAASTSGQALAVNMPLMGLGKQIGTIQCNISVKGSAGTAAGAEVQAGSDSKQFAPAVVTMFGRTGKNAGINGVYTLSAESGNLGLVVYQQANGTHIMHHCHEKWRISCALENVGSNKCVAALASTDASDPANHKGAPWVVHVGGARAMDSKDARVWVSDRAITIVRGGALPTISLAGISAIVDGIYVPSDAESNGSRIYTRDGAGVANVANAPLIRWASLRWEFFYQGHIHAFAHDGSAASPQACTKWSLKQPDKQFRQVDGATVGVVQRAAEAPDAPPQSPVRRDEPEQAHADRKRKSLRKGTTKAFAEPTFAQVGALEIVSFEAGVVTLTNVSAQPQMLEGTFFRPANGVPFQSVPLKEGKVIKPKGTLRFPIQLLGPQEQLQRSDERSRSWLGTAGGAAKCKKPGAPTGVELVSVYLMGQVICRLAPPPRKSSTEDPNTLSL